MNVLNSYIKQQHALLTLRLAASTASDNALIQLARELIESADAAARAETAAKRSIATSTACLNAQVFGGR